MTKLKKLNIDTLNSRIVRKSTTKEALKDIVPFQWNEQSINEQKIVVDREKKNV